MMYFKNTNSTNEMIGAVLSAYVILGGLLLVLMLSDIEAPWDNVILGILFVINVLLAIYHISMLIHIRVNWFTIR